MASADMCEHDWPGSGCPECKTAPAAPAEGAVKVRALQWVEVSPGSWMAHAVGLDYVVCDRQWWQGGGAATACASDHEAKAAAQADYEARIRSALTAAPAPAEDEILAKVTAMTDEQVLAEVSSEEIKQTREAFDRARSTAAPVSTSGEMVERLTRQLRALAVALHNKHYAAEAPNWRPLEDAEGILSQIDNMTTGLAKASGDALLSPEGGVGLALNAKKARSRASETGRSLRG